MQILFNHFSLYRVSTLDSTSDSVVSIGKNFEEISFKFKLVGHKIAIDLDVAKKRNKKVCKKNGVARYEISDRE